MPVPSSRPPPCPPPRPPCPPRTRTTRAFGLAGRPRRQCLRTQKWLATQPKASTPCAEAGPARKKKNERKHRNWKREDPPKREEEMNQNVCGKSSTMKGQMWVPNKRETRGRRTRGRWERGSGDEGEGLLIHSGVRAHSVPPLRFPS